ncbi:MAG: hypothetical protein IPM48_13410 [Saprospiraceae bacterium]|nr:hypothetical protein [Saprospiraceae bacterium]
MGILDKLFKSKNSDHQWIRFGRASDEVKTSEQIQLWDQAMSDFESKNYLESFECLLRYLMIPNIDNVRIRKLNDKIEFELEQGSRLVTGWMNQDHFSAKSQIAFGQDFSIGLMRQLLENCLELQHSRYCIDVENYLSIKFDGYTKEASPYRLFYGLREVAIKADKQDDLLLSEFENLKAINTTHITEYTDEIKVIKFNYFKSIIDNALDPSVLGKLDVEKYPGALTYVYLSALYKIDYLISPEGKSMEYIEKAHQNYFSQNGTDVLDRTENLKEIIKELSGIGKEKLVKELYYVHHTFGVKSVVPFAIISEFISSEMNPLEWYREQGYPEVCLAICHYIGGYVLFNFSLPEPVNELMHFYFQCNDSEYFNLLGIPSPELIDDASFPKSETKLKSKIRKILEKHRVKYPELPSEISVIFNSRIDFCVSLLRFVSTLNLNLK